MRKILTGRAAVKNRLSADNGNGHGVQKVGYVFRTVICVLIGVGQNMHFNKLARFERVGQRFDNVLRNTALTDLRNRMHHHRKGF